MLVNLKSAIAARGFRQVDLALELKIAPSVLSEIVNGRRSADVSLRARLAEVLEADESWLFSTLTRIPPRDGAGAPIPAVACAAESA